MTSVRVQPIFTWWSHDFAVTLLRYVAIEMISSYWVVQFPFPWLPKWQQSTCPLLEHISTKNRYLLTCHYLHCLLEIPNLSILQRFVFKCVYFVHKNIHLIELKVRSTPLGLNYGSSSNEIKKMMFIEFQLVMLRLILWKTNLFNLILKF